MAIDRTQQVEAVLPDREPPIDFQPALCANLHIDYARPCMLIARHRDA
jgi:hypothetical protein